MPHFLHIHDGNLVEYIDSCPECEPPDDGSENPNIILGDE